jgi:hypothetical protein
VQKGRDGVSSRPELFTVKGVKALRSNGQGPRVAVLETMEVEWGGRIEADTAEGDLKDRILRVLNADPDAVHSRKAVAQGVGESKPESPGGTFKRAWAALLERNLTAKDGQGVRLTDEGKTRATALGLEC